MSKKQDTSSDDTIRDLEQVAESLGIKLADWQKAWIDSMKSGMSPETLQYLSKRYSQGLIRGGNIH